MATRRTWIWIIGGVAAAGLIGVIALAGAGVYFVSRHVQAEPTSTVEAIASFDSVAGTFSGRRALYELDAQDRPVLTTQLSSLPTAAESPSSLMVQFWNPAEERLVRLTLPFWLLRFNPNHISAGHSHRDFDLHQLQLDVDQLERIGPMLVLDYRNQDGVRVLLWTK